MSGKNMIANRYEVIQHIGQGGMADVFLAIDTILNRQVAIKILRADLSTDAVSILRFEREAQAATALAIPILWKSMMLVITRDIIISSWNMFPARH